jgi:hypothetical protein
MWQALKHVGLRYLGASPTEIIAASIRRFLQIIGVIVQFIDRAKVWQAIAHDLNNDC